jgi:hypothetical protein
MPEDNINVIELIKSKTCKEFQNFLEITSTIEQTYVIVVAYHLDRARNFINRINCKKGLPIGGYIYDSQSDCYHLECADYLPLGYVPMSFSVKVKGLSDWQTRVPMPENVLKKFFNSLQKKELKNFKNKFPLTHYEIQFIQMIDPN